MHGKKRSVCSSFLLNCFWSRACLGKSIAIFFTKGICMNDRPLRTCGIGPVPDQGGGGWYLGAAYKCTSCEKRHF